MSMEPEAKGATEILDPARLDPVDSVDFCGACHHTWQDVVTNGFVNTGQFNVRLAPYRLENSRCWGKGDARLTCIACHDPHKPLVSGTRRRTTFLACDATSCAARKGLPGAPAQRVRSRYGTA
jgi:hypothetical protein